MSDDETGRLRILAIEDDSMMHVLLRHGLAELADGELVIAGTGEEGLALAAANPPELVLVDLVLPDMSGEQVVERLRQNESTASVPVIVLTGAARNLNDEALRRWSVGGVIEKPFDPRTLAQQVVTLMRGESSRSPHEPDAIDAIRRSFLEEGLKVTGEMLAAGEIELERTLQFAHLLAGRGGTLGFPRVSELARALEDALADSPPDGKVVEATVTQLHEFFRSDPAVVVARDQQARSAPDDMKVSDDLAAQLEGKRIALVGFDGDEFERLRQALDSADAFHRSFDACKVDGVDHFDLIVARAETEGDALLTCLKDVSKPSLVVGPPELLSARRLTAVNRDFLVAPWKTGELLLRAHHLLVAQPIATPGEAAAVPRDRPLVIIADDDSAITALIASTLAGNDIDCRVVANGAEALERVLSEPPDALVLDVNMPGLDGFEVLSRIKSAPETSRIPVLMLTARHRETDIIRGFRLGADDYMVKPFNPTELLARLFRFIRSSR